MGMFPSRELVSRVKAMYPRGRRVEVDYMNDPYGVASGTQGTVMYVDDIGTVHVRWDNGSSLGLVYGEDRFHLVEG